MQTNVTPIYILLSFILVVYFCSPCSTIITSNSQQNDPDFQKLSPPTYFIQQGGYADENTTLWVDKTGIVTWITNDNKLQKQNLEDLLPSFDFTCTVIQPLNNNFPSNSVMLAGAVVVYQCGKTKDMAQDFFFCPQYNCYPIASSTRIHLLNTPSAIVFRKDTQPALIPSELYIYNMLTKQGLSKVVPNVMEITVIGEFMIAHYSANNVFVYNGLTGYQSDKIGTVIVDDEYIVIIYTESSTTSSKALLLSRNNNQPIILDSSVDFDPFTINSSYKAGRYQYFHANRKTTNTKELFGFDAQLQQFVSIKCANSSFADDNTIVFTDLGVYSFCKR